MDNEINEIIEDIDNLLIYSDFYFYPNDKDYKNHRKNIKKLKKKLKHGEIKDCVKKGCDLY